MPDNEEYEASLIIYGDRPGNVFDDLGKLPNLKHFVFLQQPDQNIEDIYFDTQSGQLANFGFGLRLRKIGKKQFVTLKGKSEKLAGGGIQRLEMEFPWGKDGWHKISGFLNSEIRGLNIALNLDENLGPDKFLSSLGLITIQHRKNHRQVRFIIENKNRPDILAELVMDSMTLFFNKEAIHLFEIEIEAKSKPGKTATDALLGLLEKRYQKNAEVWDFSKLATGLAIEKLWVNPVFMSTLDNNLNLTGDSYKILKQNLMDLQK